MARARNTYSMALHEGHDIPSDAVPFGHALYNVYVDYCRLPALGSGRRTTAPLHGIEPKMTLQQLNTVAHDLNLLAPYGRLTPSQMSNIYMSYKPVGSSHLTFATFLQALAAVANFADISPDDLYAAVSQLGSEAATSQYQVPVQPVQPVRSASARPAQTHDAASDAAKVHTKIATAKGTGSRFQNLTNQNSQSAPIPVFTAREVAAAVPVLKPNLSPYLGKPQRSAGSAPASQQHANLPSRQSLEPQVNSIPSKEQQVTLQHLSPRLPEPASHAAHHSAPRSTARQAGASVEEGLPDWVQHMMSRLWALEHSISSAQQAGLEHSTGGKVSAASTEGAHQPFSESQHMLKPRDSNADKQLPRQDSTSLPPPPLSQAHRSAVSPAHSMMPNSLGPDWAVQVVKQMQAMQETCDKAVKLAEASQAEVTQLQQQVKVSSSIPESGQESLACAVAELETRQKALETQFKPDVQSQLELMQQSLQEMRQSLDRRIDATTASCNTLSAQIATVSQVASNALKSSSRPTSAVSARRSGTNIEPASSSQVSQQAMKLASEAAAGVEVLASQVKALAAATPAPPSDDTAKRFQDAVQSQLDDAVKRLEKVEKSRETVDEKLTVTSSGQMDILTRVSLMENRMATLQQVQFADLQDGTSTLLQQLQQKMADLQAAHQQKVSALEATQQQLREKIAATSMLPQMQARLAELENSVVELCEKVPHDHLDNLVSARATMESRSRAMQDLSANVVGLSESLARLEGKSERSEASLQDATKRMANIESQIQKAHQRAGDVDKQLQDHQTLRGEVAAMQAAIEPLSQQVAKANDKLKEQDTATTKLQGLVQGIQKQMDISATASKDQVVQLEQSVNSSIKDLKAALESVTKATDKATLEARLKELGLTKEMQSSAAPAIPSEHLQHLEQSISDMQAELSSLSKAQRNSATEARIAALEQALPASSPSQAVLDQNVTNKVQERLADLEQTVPQHQSHVDTLQAQVTILEQLVHNLQSRSSTATETGSTSGKAQRPKSSRLKRSSTAESVILTTQLQELQDKVQWLAGRVADAEQQHGVAVDAKSSTGSLPLAKSTELNDRLVIQVTGLEADLAALRAGPIKDFDEVQGQLQTLSGQVNGLGTQVADNVKAVDQLRDQLEQHKSFAVAAAAAAAATPSAAPAPSAALVTPEDLNALTTQVQTVASHLSDVEKRIPEQVKELESMILGRLEQYKADAAVAAAAAAAPSPAPSPPTVTAEDLNALKTQVQTVASHLSNVEKNVPEQVKGLESIILGRLEQSKADAAADRDQWSGKANDLASKVAALETELKRSTQQLHDEMKKQAPPAVAEAPAAAASPAPTVAPEAVQKLSEEVESLRASVYTKAPEGMVPREEMMRALGTVTTELSNRIKELRQKVGLSPPSSAHAGGPVPTSLEGVVQILAKTQVDLKNEQHVVQDELHVLRARLDELELSGPGGGGGHGDADPLLQSKVDTAMKKVEDLSTAFMLINDRLNQRIAAVESALQPDEYQASSQRREPALPPESPSLSYGMAPAATSSSGAVRFREEYAPPQQLEVHEEYVPAPASRAGLLPGTAQVISPKNNAAALLRPKSAREKVALLVAEEMNESQRREERLKNDEARIQAQRAAVAAAKKTAPQRTVEDSYAARPTSARPGGSAGSARVGFSTEDYGAVDTYRSSANTGYAGGGSGALMARNQSDYGTYENTGKASLSLDTPAARPRSSFGGNGGLGVGMGMGGMMGMGQQMSPARMAAFQQQQQSMYMNMRHQQMQAQQASSLRKL